MPTEVTPSRPATWDDIIRHTASEHGVPAELALAVAQTESGFDPKAVSPKGANGMFQLMPETAKGLGVDPTDPVQNIQGGIKYLKQQLDANGGNVEKALQAYNWGPGNVAKGGTPPPETQAYVQKILGRLKPAAEPPKRIASVTQKDMVQNIATPPPGPRMDAGPPGASSLLGKIGSGFDPRTREGRRNLAGGVGDIAGTAAGVAAGTFFPPAEAVLPAAGGAVGSGIAGAAEEAGERMFGTAPPDSSLMAAGGEQAAYSLGGRALAWPIRAAGKRLVAGRVGRFAAQHFEETLAGAKDALQQARAVAGDAVSRATESASSMFNTAKEGAAEHVARAREYGRSLVGGTTKAAKEGAEGVSSRYDRIAKAPPTVSPTQAGQRAQEVITGPAHQAREEVGQLVEQTAKTGPPVDIRPLKEEAKRILTEEIRPSQESFPRTPAEVDPQVQDLTALLEKTAGTEARTPSQVAGREALQQALAQAQENQAQTVLKHPAMQVLGRVLNAEDTVPFQDAHLFKRELDDAIGTNWDRSVKNRVVNITKVLRGTLRDSLSVHEPYDTATKAYQAIAPLYTKGLAPKLRRQAVEAPEAIIHLIKPKDPTQVKMLRDLLVSQPGKVGKQAEGQFAWDSVRSAWTHQNLIKGSIDKLPDRIAKLDPEFKELMYGDGPGSMVLDHLTQISDAYQQAIKTGAEDVAGAKARATAGVEEAKQVGRGATATARTAGSTLKSETKKAGKEYVGKSLQDVINARQGQAGLKNSTVGARRMAGETTADVLRATFLGPSSLWGGLSIARLLKGPKGAELVRYAAYSPEGTQLLVRGLTSPVPPVGLSELLRASGIGAVVKGAFKEKPAKEVAAPPPGPNASLIGAPPP
jgi:hypothetical protein